MKHNPFKRQPSPARSGDIDLLFGPRYNHKSFPAFYGSMQRPNDLNCIDDMASAYRLYLYLGELKNAR